MLRIAAVILCTSCVFGESLYAVRGEVKDASGAIVPEALVGFVSKCDSSEAMAPAVIAGGQGEFQIFEVWHIRSPHLRVAKAGYRPQCFPYEQNSTCVEPRYRETVRCMVTHLVLESR